MTQPVLVFLAGGVRCGVGLADVARLLVEDVVLPVPFSHAAMVGVVDDGPAGAVPVFDLRGLVDPQAALPSSPGATVALFPTAKGPVGLRLEKLFGTASEYAPTDAALDVPAPLQKTMTGAAIAQGERFAFFSPEAFLAAIGL